MKNKVAVIGGGNVGASTALYIAERGLADVTLIDIVEGMPQGKALDMQQAAPLVAQGRQPSRLERSRRREGLGRGRDDRGLSAQAGHVALGSAQGQRRHHPARGRGGEAARARTPTSSW